MPDAHDNLAPEAIDALAAKLRGTVERSGTPGYEVARTVWNAMVDRRPSAIARPLGVADVQACVRFAREAGVPLAITGTFRMLSAQWIVSGSARSPARKSARNRDRSCPSSSFAFGSSFWIARKAVGAVNRVTTPCSAMTRQYAPASGVPTGLPS